MADGLWACGTVGRAHGLKGEVYLALLPSGLAYLTGGERFFLERPGAATPEPVGLTRLGGTDAHPLIRLEGVESREAAVALHGTLVLAAGDDLDEGVEHFPVNDLIGCRVVVGADEIGTVRDVLMNPAHDILEIEGPDGAGTLVPFVAELVEVDLEHRLIRVREGLL
jgi:16S rRNA processing protein RimM